jgi:hypothetical protein
VERQFPVIPVEAGINRFFSKKCSPIPKNFQRNQRVAGEFPWQANREFCRPNRELNPQNRELRESAFHQAKTSNKNTGHLAMR